MNRSSFLAAVAATTALPRAASAAETGLALVTPTGTIAGTLRLPDGARGAVPCVLVIAGSGPTDRDGNNPQLGPLNVYRKLAEGLAATGVASVRYDKRGVAASRASAPAESTLRFDDYAGDAASWIRLLRADPRFSRIVVAGHSEGSLVGMVAAPQAPPDALVSLEGAGFPAADVLRTQLAERLAAEPELAAKADAILDALVRGTSVPEADVPAPLLVLFRASVQPYLISWFRHDPRVAIARVPGRVTIVQGTHDLQVPETNGRALAAARPDARYVAIAGMTHVLTDDPATTLAAQLAGAYVDASRPLDPAVVHTLVDAATA